MKGLWFKADKKVVFQDDVSVICSSLIQVGQGRRGDGAGTGVSASRKACWSSKGEGPLRAHVCTSFMDFVMFARDYLATHSSLMMMGPSLYVKRCRRRGNGPSAADLPAWWWLHGAGGDREVSVMPYVLMNGIMIYVK